MENDGRESNLRRSGEEGFTEVVTSKQRHGWWEGASHVKIQGKRVSGKQNNKIKALRKDESEILLFEKEVAGKYDGV